MTKKRAKQTRQYSKNRKIFINEQREKNKQGLIFCIFCGKVIYGEPNLHHGNGRDDEEILNEYFWFLAHQECHVNQYHSMSCTDIKWWPTYIKNIQERCPEIYQKELIRMNKAGIS